MASGDRTIGVLNLFTLETPAWTVEDAATALGVSGSSAYRYFAALHEAGFLTTESMGRYILGPAFLQYDRQIQLTDPLLQVARPIMDALSNDAPDGATLVLCRVFRETVLCVHQVAGPGPQPLVSYERGRPMPLFRGATSTIILAHLPSRQLRKLYDRRSTEIADAGLGGDWPTVRARLAALRKARHAITYRQVDPGSVGIAAPILDVGRKVLGSLSVVVADEAAEETRVRELAAFVMGGAREIERILAGDAVSTANEAAS